MKIEKISDNQIKCTLTRSDLASRQLKISELAYGTEKANNLFRDMMDQANLEFGFDANDLPIMIEAIPVSMDCIILMITKVEDPEEVDTRFSSLANLRELFSRDGSEDTFVPSETPHDGFLQLGDLAREALKAAQTPAECLISFRELKDVLCYARFVNAVFAGESSLYKSPENGRYYLVLKPTVTDAGTLSYLTASSVEFGTNESASAARIAFLEEHYEKILNGSAVQDLAGI
ncbi:MAG: adaptor protein MecA [Parasporobacterium sp.]|nr:adaptor protein MecA [Parasporobacterium sp.]